MKNQRSVGLLIHGDIKYFLSTVSVIILNTEHDQFPILALQEKVALVQISQFQDSLPALCKINFIIQKAMQVDANKHNRRLNSVKSVIQIMNMFFYRCPMVYGSWFSKPFHMPLASSYLIFFLFLMSVPTFRNVFPENSQ